MSDVSSFESDSFAGHHTVVGVIAIHESAIVDITICPNTPPRRRLSQPRRIHRSGHGVADVSPQVGVPGCEAERVFAHELCNTGVVPASVVVQQAGGSVLNLAGVGLQRLVCRIRLLCNRPECVVLAMIHQRGSAVPAAGHCGHIGHRVLMILQQPQNVAGSSGWSKHFIVRQGSTSR